MVRPVRFCYNAETAVDNAFMKDTSSGYKDPQIEARQEFDNYVSILRAKGVEVACFEDTPEQHKPDSIFPNNWISFHEDGTLVLYPMKAQNRRIERRADIIEALEKQYNYKITQKIDISEAEAEEKFLEGTGSIIFDYINRIAYACILKELTSNCWKISVLSWASEHILFQVSMKTAWRSIIQTL